MFSRYIKQVQLTSFMYAKISNRDNVVDLNNGGPPRQSLTMEQVCFPKW